MQWTLDTTCEAWRALVVSLQWRMVGSKTAIYNDTVQVGITDTHHTGTYERRRAMTKMLIVAVILLLVGIGIYHKTNPVAVIVGTVKAWRCPYDCGATFSGTPDNCPECGAIVAYDLGFACIPSLSSIINKRNKKINDAVEKYGPISIDNELVRAAIVDCFGGIEGVEITKIDHDTGWGIMQFEAVKGNFTFMCPYPPEGT